MSAPTFLGFLYVLLCAAAALALHSRPSKSIDPWTTDGRASSDVQEFPKEQLSKEEIQAELGLIERDRERCASRESLFNEDCLKFIHLPKHAGTSIEAWAHGRGYRWGRHFLHVGIHDPGSNPVVTGPVIEFAPWHAPPTYFRRNPYRGFHTFVVVRDPYEHMISEFRCKYFGYLASRPLVPVAMDGFKPGEMPNAKILSDAERKQLRRNATAEDLNDWIKSMMKHAPDWWWGHIPYSKYVFDANGDRLVPEDNVLHLENLTAEFADLVARYNLTSGALPTTNSKTDVPEFSVDDLREDTRRAIEDAFGDDFHAFGYKKLRPKHGNALDWTKVFR